ncbi:MAG: hypothetical protein DLM73_09970 [Chthoniobacterales bacterium]|nr:MAG: hypothetical protein DLM73_09970 [Chthoniobacterales bacterium]
MKRPIWKRAAGKKGKSAHRKAAQYAKKYYPGGKALQRIKYFETQRDLACTTLVRGFVTSEASAAPRISRKAPARPSVKPAAEYAKANRAKSRLIPTKFAASVALPVWRPLGPTIIPHGQTYGTGGNNKPPVAGRCSGVCISPSNPNHLVLCSGGGGLWETLDQGTTWRPLTDQQPTLSMGAICAAPSSPNIVYAGTGDGDNQSQLGVGLLRSSDGGQTWEHLPANELSGIGVHDLAVDPSNPLHVWAGTSEKLLESTDGGVTWRAAQLTTTWDISVNPNDPQEIFAATVPGLVRSGDGGATWTRVALPGSTPGSRFSRMEVCHAPSNPAIVYVGAVLDKKVMLWRRASNGGAFSAEKPPSMKANSDIDQAWYDWCMAISPVDPSILYWGAVELYKGMRGASGWTWRNISSRASGDSIHPDQHHLAFDPSDANVLFACNDGGVFRSPDGGASWKALNKGLSITEFEFLIHLESDDNWLIGGTQDNGTLGQPDNGTWNQIALGDGGDCGADDTNKLCYHSFYGIGIERAPATGPNAFKWKDVSPPAPDDYEALFYPPMDVSDRLIAKAGVTVWISDDSGDNWNEVDYGGTGGEMASAVSIVDAKTLIIGTENGRLARVARATSGWAKATVTQLTSPLGGFLSDIVVLGTTKQLIWTSSSAFGGGHVFRSTNGGKTWSNRTGNLPDIPVNAIVIDPKNTQRIFAATDHGVYRSQNAGTKWTDFSNGLPNAVIGDMILHERRRVLRIGTRNRGAWEVAL